MGKLQILKNILIRNDSYLRILKSLSLTKETNRFNIEWNGLSKRLGKIKNYSYVSLSLEYA